MTESHETVLVDAGALIRYCGALFEDAGMAAHDARLCAEQLVTADLRGVESHGVVRMAIYLERLRCGVVSAKPAIRTVGETRSTAVVAGDNGMGQIVGEHAMRLAVAKAQQHGEPAHVAVGGSNHFG